MGMAKLAEQSGARIIMGKVECVNCCNADGSSESPSPLTSFDNLSQRKVVSITYVNEMTLEQHTLPATTAVLAAGPWTPTLFPKVRVHPLRAHSVTLKLQRPVSAYCLFSDIRLGDLDRPLEQRNPSRWRYMHARTTRFTFVAKWIWIFPCQPLVTLWKSPPIVAATSSTLP